MRYDVRVLYRIIIALTIDPPPPHRPRFIDLIESVAEVRLFGRQIGRFIRDGNRSTGINYVFVFFSCTRDTIVFQYFRLTFAAGFRFFMFLFFGVNNAFSELRM